VSIKPFIKLMQRGQLTAFTGINALFKPFYRLTYLAALKQGGLMDMLAQRPMAFDELTQSYGQSDKAREALEAWLQLGLRLGYLARNGDAYSLRGLAKKLSLPHNDAALALAQEVAGLHHRLILQTPEKLAGGTFWQLADQDGTLIARSSRTLEAFQTEAIDRYFPASGAAKLLEIGCGSGFYIQYGLSRNPAMTAVGLEMQADVAAAARRNIDEWQLQQRVTIEHGDIRHRAAEAQFDIATLYNNIYYFPVPDRVAALQHVRQCLRPGGFLLLTTCCQGGNPGMEVLNLWGAATETGGRLPGVGELVDQLHQAGYQDIQTTRLIPGDGFYAFKASAPA